MRYPRKKNSDSEDRKVLEFIEAQLNTAYSMRSAKRNILP